MARYTAPTLVLLGCCGLGWGIIDAKKFGYLTILAGIYGIFLGFAVWLFEKYVGGARHKTALPTRAMGYLVLSIFLFASEPTLTVAFFMLSIAIMNGIAFYYGEVYPDEDKARRNDRLAFKATTDDSLAANVTRWYEMKRDQNKLGTLIFISAYFISNIIIFSVAVDTWYVLNDSLPPEDRLSGWGPFAKGFGNLLDFNCSIILVPVLRSMLRWLYNASTADQGFFSRMLRAVLWVVPIDRNITFHKLIARMILFSTAGHTFFHFVNYAYRPDQTMRLFTIWPWISGGMLLLIMLFMYSATEDNTKLGQFEIFWYSHHLFVLFFLLLLTHGRYGWNPNFYKWFFLPGALYVLERLLRVMRGNKEVVILSVTYMKPDVLSLEFEKTGIFAAPYKEGQYIFLNAPAISAVQWHPFTISSAPGQDSVTVHIKVIGARAGADSSAPAQSEGSGSWTFQLKEYILKMGPRDSPYFELTRQGANGKVRGKILGPDGTRLLRIDGPHSAPTQHIGEYSTVMVIGAGIGVTPVAATLRSIVNHRWKFDVGKSYPNSAYFFWACSYSDLDAFRWLIRFMKQAQDEVCHMRSKNPEAMRTKMFEIHVYITSVPKDVRSANVVVEDDTSFWGTPEKGATVDKVRAPFNEMDLYNVMKAPPEHTQMGDIHIWNGRPNWAPRFEDVSQDHPQEEIGVTFCGNRIIASDLGLQCYLASIGRQKKFKFHKENF